MPSGIRMSPQAIRFFVAHQNINELPADLAFPVDDGACDHLVGMQIPNMDLAECQGGVINPSRIKDLSVICIRGCTPQTNGFRDHNAEFVAKSVKVIALYPISIVLPPPITHL
jgi:hypothetical protein